MENTISAELLLHQLNDITFGKHIGQGCTRTVFEMEYDKTKVIKKAINEQGKRDNIIEYEVWNQIKWTDYKKWFAPIYEVSEHGDYLIMDRAIVRDKDKYPKRIPTFFHDTKYKNYGFIKGNFVIVDYASIGFVDGLNKRMKNANWWGEDNNNIDAVDMI